MRGGRRYSPAEHRQRAGRRKHVAESSSISPVSRAPPPPPGGVRRGFVPTLIDVGDVFSRAVTIYTQNFALCVGVGSVAMLLMMLAGGSMGLAGVHLRHGEQLLPHLVLSAICYWLWFGYLNFSLKVARGDSASFSDLFAAGPYFVHGVAAAIITSIASIVGLILLVVPGVVLWLMLFQSVRFVIDQNVGFVDALSMSMDATAGNKFALFLLWIVAVGIYCIVGLLTCGLGILVVQPFVTLLFSVAYLSMTGQSTAAQPAGREPPVRFAASRWSG